MPTLSLCSWNVNGLRAIAKKTFPEFLKAKAPDVLCLQEIKANAEQAQALELPYPFCYWHPADRPGYSGTAILSKQKPLDVQTGFLSPKTVAAHPQEGRILRAEFEEFFLVNVYVPNAKTDLSRLEYRTQSWGPDFRALLSTLAKKKPVIVCGDFNVAHEEIDLARPADNHMSAGFTDAEREDFSKLLKAGFVDLLRHENPQTPGLYSWWSYRMRARERNVGWRIDYFLSSPALKSAVKAHRLMPEIQGSDHCPVWLELKA